MSCVFRPQRAVFPLNYERHFIHLSENSVLLVFGLYFLLLSTVRSSVQPQIPFMRLSHLQIRRLLFVEIRGFYFNLLSRRLILKMYIKADAIRRVIPLNV